MKELTSVCIGIVVICLVTFMLFAGMDREVARTDYVKNVEQCKPIDGCLFDWNCRHYNKMIEKECE